MPLRAWAANRPMRHPIPPLRAWAAKPRAKNMPNSPPSQWHYDEELGAWIRNTIHQMGRRCYNWDYSGLGTYMITLTQKNRRIPLLGQLAGTCATDAHIALTELGQRIEAHLLRIPEFSPGLEVLGYQLMPEHLHFVLRAFRHLNKPLGIALRGFKGGCSKIYWETFAAGLQSPCAAGLPSPCAPGLPSPCAPGLQSPCAPRLPSPGPLFSPGYVDNILFDDTAVANALAYLRDNPRRLWEKRAHPECFTLLRDLPVRLRLGTEVTAHFSAIGNQHLLKAPIRLQVQCSRSLFAYRRNDDGTLLKEASPTLSTPDFQEKLAGLLEAAAHGAVLVSPCISHGEKEIARQACQAGYKVIVLANKGFSPLGKPSGRLFDQCAKGNLLMLAPSAWPYLPGEKPITRMDACILNRLAQAIADQYAVEIRYRDIVPTQIDAQACLAVKA